MPSSVLRWIRRVIALPILLVPSLSLQNSTLAGCSGTSRTPIVVEQRVQSLMQPPPALPPGVLSGILDNGCPEEWFCMTRESAIDLFHWIGQRSEWEDGAWTLCGPAPPAGSVVSSSTSSAPASAGAPTPTADAPTGGSDN